MRRPVERRSTCTTGAHAATPRPAARSRESSCSRRSRGPERPCCAPRAFVPLLESDRPLETPAEADVEMGAADATTWTRRPGGRRRRVAAAAGEHARGRPARPARRLRAPTRAPFRPGGSAAPSARERKRPASSACSPSTARRGLSAGRRPTSGIEGDDELQRRVRFALFHLMASAADAGEAAVGARGLTGPGVPRTRLLGQRRLRAALPRRDASGGSARDARVPPPAARSGRAPRRAALGRAGARFPWESARAGIDVTPSHAHDQTGSDRRRSAPASSRSTSSPTSPGRPAATWTGGRRRPSPTGPGRELLIETARYWASRIRVDRTGAATSTA